MPLTTRIPFSRNLTSGELVNRKRAAHLSETLSGFRMIPSPARRVIPAIIIALFVFLIPGSAGAQANAWLKHVSVLSHDSMRGRETGSREHRIAANYIAREFRKIGLRPAGDHGYLQTVRFVARQPVEDSSLVEIVRNGRSEALRFGDDVSLSARVAIPPSVEAPLVFAGYGLYVPEKGVDDLSAIDLRGKIVVVLSGAPRAVAGPALSSAQNQRWKELRKRGAVGLITVADPRVTDVPPERARAARLLPQMALTDTTLDETLGEQFAGTFTATFAERLFSTSAHQLSELRTLARDGKPLPKFDIGATLRAHTTMRTWPVVSQNVAGILRGSDRRLRSEYVVLTAHMDHLGVGLPVNGDSIFNGALDNASGVATMIEAAKKLARGRPLRRSLVFVAVTGEEKGLLGSRYFANHPTVPASAIVADANTDMLTAFYPLRSVIVNGLEESDLAADVRRAAAKTGLEAQTDPEPERNSFVRSDQYSFIKLGIPSVSLKFGFAPGSPEHEMVKRFRTERYHGVKDDLMQPIDFAAVEKFNEFYVELVREIANRGTRPAWNEDSYFRARN